MKQRTLVAMGRACALNFFTAAALGFWHGDALSGKVVEGHYYLGQHGSFNEVTRTAFIFSYVYTVTGILSLGGIAWVDQRSKRGGRRS